MKILQVVLSLGMGGQERLIVRIAQALQERGHDVGVVTLTPGGDLRRALDGIPIHDVGRRDGFDPSLYAKLWWLFREQRPDVVHTHNAAPLVYAAPAARAARVPCVVHTKHGNFTYPRQTLRLARVASKVVDHFVSVSAETSVAAERNERPIASRRAVIENGIPLRSFKPDAEARAAIRDELGIPRDALVVGSVGRLVADKDYPLLVEAMAPLIAGGRFLVLVGEGVARPDIEAAVKRVIGEKDRGRVILTGSRHDVQRVLCAFDLFASSSRTEGLPLALPEAMTSGLPIVATAVGGVPGIVPSEAGVLVPHGDPAALRSAIEALLTDTERRSRLSESARAYAIGRFAEERMLDDYLARYARPNR